ncbi:reverse transcriptase domain-containing protein [Tanacetum coccineum]
MASPKTLREIQSLNGKLAALGLFLAKLAERRIAKWAIELGEHEIIYKPRSAVKGHILADFLTESPIITDPQEKSIADKPRKNTSPAWTLFTDSAASLEGSGVGIILTDPSGQEVKGLYEAREELMRRYLFKVQELLGHFQSFIIMQIPRSKNKRADALSPEQANYVLREEHLRSCDAHTRPMSITQKSARLGYYWPMMYQDAIEVVETCHKCQQHAPTIRQPQCEMPSILISWPFYQWRIDIDQSLVITQSNLQIILSENGARSLKSSRISHQLPTLKPMDKLRISTFDLTKNDENLCLNLDLLEERQELAALKNARKNEASRKEGQKKLDPNWEGPYQVIEARRIGTYVLSDMKRRPIPRTWHISNLRRFHL